MEISFETLSYISIIVTLVITIGDLIYKHFRGAYLLPDQFKDLLLRKMGRYGKIAFATNIFELVNMFDEIVKLYDKIDDTDRALRMIAKFKGYFNQLNQDLKTI